MLRNVLAGARRARARSFAAVAEPAAAGPTWQTVPFKKEDMNAVMQEVPDFDYYHIGGDAAENAYMNVNMSQSILPSEFTPATGDGKYHFSKLENGLKVVSCDNGGTVADVGLYVKAGSRWEAASDFGCSHMLELVAFRSTAHLSHLRTVKTLETLGVDAKCEASREHIGYSASMMREYVPVVVPLLVGNVLFPRLLPWEVNAAHELVAASKTMSTDEAVTELLVQTAYHTNTLGHPLHATEHSVTANFKPETLRNYMLKHFSPDRMVMVGVNVAHDALATWAMRSFVDYNAIPHQKRDEPKAKYTGGGATQTANVPNLHLALGFETSGLASKDLYATTVVQALLGTAMGQPAPGSGLHTRLAGLLGKGVESAMAFHQPFSDSGILGIYASCPAAQGAALPGLLKEELTKLSKLQAGELERAKAQAATQLSAALEAPSALAEDIATQVLASDKVASAEEMAAAISKVTDGDVQRVVKSMLASNPTMVAYGNTTTAPLYSDVQSLFKK
jgi:processing peptidase subunit alpha